MDFGNNGLTGISGIHVLNRDAVIRDQRTTGSPGGTGSFRVSIGDMGGGQPHNNMPPYTPVYYWIKAEDVDTTMSEGITQQPPHQEPAYRTYFEVPTLEGEPQFVAVDNVFTTPDILILMLLGVLVLVALRNLFGRQNA